MTKTHRRAATSADEAFNRHYAAIFGEQRWNESLRPALIQPTRYACLLNRYAQSSDANAAIQVAGTETRPLLLPPSEGTDRAAADVNGLSQDYLVRYVKVTPSADQEPSALPSSIPFPPPAVSSNGLLSHWNLDGASVLVASLLNVQPGENILDLCAAPGGKSIALAQNLWPHLHADDSSLKRTATDAIALRKGSLHSNESDGTRQKRLAENLKSYLPSALFETKQAVAMRVDASRPNAEHEFRVRTAAATIGYDKVLVDAPCSSERHVIHAHEKAQAVRKVADEMANWRAGTSKRLAKVQVDLLMTGLKAAEIGGIVIYATCSIEPTENDGVVEKALAQVEKERKKGLKWSVQLGFNRGSGNQEMETELERTWAERTTYGWIILPDHPSGGTWGPLFFAVLTKVGD